MLLVGAFTLTSPGPINAIAAEEQAGREGTRDTVQGQPDWTDRMRYRTLGPVTLFYSPESEPSGCSRAWNRKACAPSKHERLSRPPEKLPAR